MAKDAIITPASDEEIPALIDRLITINREMKALKEEAKTIESRLAAAAKTKQHTPLKDESREGRQVILRSGNYALPVRFTSDALIKSFKADSPKHKELMFVLSGTANPQPEQLDEADRALRLFFNPPNAWETRYDDGQKFRAAAAEWLPPELAPKFIAACRSVDKGGIPKSTTVVALDDVEEVTAP